MNAHAADGVLIDSIPLRRVTWEDWRRSYASFAVEMHLDHESCAVLWGERRLLLGDRPQMFRLIAGFLNAPGQRLDRPGLVAAMYPEEDFTLRSARFFNAKRHNAVKMISRTRTHVMLAFARCGAAAFDWFPYDRTTGTWQLMRLRSEIARKAA